MLKNYIQRLSNNLLIIQSKNFSHPMWTKKTRRYFKPTYFDNVNYNNERRWDDKESHF